MPEFIAVKAAYGKELLSEKDVLQHYLDGKDFMIFSLHHGAGSYLNKQNCDITNTRGIKAISLEVRFGKKSQKVTILDTTKPQVLQKKLEGKIRQAIRKGKGKEV